jgi:hypothetical protein
VSGIPRGAVCFECTATDGRVVRLHKDTYYGHIKPHHPEIERDYDYPVGEIQKALVSAQSTQPGITNQRMSYLGPAVTPKTNPGPERFKVVVQKEVDNKGFVVTAFPQRIF